MWQRFMNVFNPKKKDSQVIDKKKDVPPKKDVPKYEKKNKKAKRTFLEECALAWRLVTKPKHTPAPKPKKPSKPGQGPSDADIKSRIKKGRQANAFGGLRDGFLLFGRSKEGQPKDQAAVALVPKPDDASSEADQEDAGEGVVPERAPPGPSAREASGGGRGGGRAGGGIGRLIVHLIHSVYMFLLVIAIACLAVSAVSYTVDTDATLTWPLWLRLIAAKRHWPTSNSLRYLLLNTGGYAGGIVFAIGFMLTCADIAMQVAGDWSRRRPPPPLSGSFEDLTAGLLVPPQLRAQFAARPHLPPVEPPDARTAGWLEKQQYFFRMAFGEGMASEEAFLAYLGDSDNRPLAEVLRDPPIYGEFYRQAQARAERGTGAGGALEDGARPSAPTSPPPAAAAAAVPPAAAPPVPRLVALD